MKITFLDIDGVFNSAKWFKSEKFKTETMGMSDAQVMLQAHHTHLDPEAIQLMNALVQRSGAQVVLSSTWRIVFSIEEMNAMLKKRGATFTISASTPVLWKMPRGMEIEKFLDESKDKIESFVILDDNDDMAGVKLHLVQTDYQFGLTKENVDKALNILNVSC